MSLRQLLNFIYSWAIQRVESEKVEDWIAGLNQPFWTERKASRASTSTIEEELAVFRSAAG